MDLKEIVNKIVAESDLSEEKAKEKILEKEKELDGLVSRVGAAHIVANELGVKTLEKKLPKRFNVADLKPDMNGVDVDLEVQQVYEASEFTTKSGRKGAVGSFLGADETGRIRVALWNTHAKAVKKMKEGDVIRLVNCYTRENRGRVELNLGSRGRLTLNPEGVSVEGVEREQLERKKLSDASPGEVVEVRAAVVQHSDRPPFYDACPKCNKSVRDGVCEEHGEVDPEKRLIVSGFIDDGTTSVRAVFFSQAAEAVLGMKREDVISAADPYENLPLGKQFVFTGRFRHNEMFDRNEITVFGVEEVDPEKEAERVAKAAEKA